MNEPEFLSREEILAIHRQQLDLFGGTDGIVSDDMLESAIGQAWAVFHYLEDVDLFEVAAAYAFSISQDQQTSRS
jgi:death-on-curing protein